jgi:L-ascorbate metabolism protein UlaG (beta-lactamase superfamily)
MKTILFIFILLVVFRQGDAATSEVIPTAKGDLTITFIGHGTLYFTWQNKVFHIDPWSQLADYSGLPKADVILITHQHRDHLDAKAVSQIRKDDTVALLTQQCAVSVDGRVVKNGDSLAVAGVSVRVVPAYNIVHKRDSGEPFHPKGEGNGYVMTFADVTVYVAGDTENIPEMAALKGKVDIAFLPVNLPYTMDAAMAVDAARTIAPKILYPYHYSDDEVKKLVQLLQGEVVDIRIRNMQ